MLLFLRSSMATLNGESNFALFGPEGLTGRFPPGGELPGWSFHGGEGMEIANFDLTRALVLNTDISNILGTIGQGLGRAAINFVWSQIKEEVQDAVTEHVNIDQVPQIAGDLLPDPDGPDWALFLGDGNSGSIILRSM